MPILSRVALVVACSLALGSLSAQADDLTPAEHLKRTKEIEAFVRTDLQKIGASLAVPEPHAAIRDLSHAALAYLMLGEGPDKGAAKAQAMLEKVFAAQVMDPVPASEFGKVPWSMNNPDVHDDNAIEFTTSAMMPALILYADRFPQAFLDAAVPHLKAAAAAVAWHNIPASYTNIALMKPGNLILLGEYLHDPALVAQGKALIGQWLAYTRQNGIHEFDSPTYAQTQINVLTTLYHTVHDPEVKAETKVILDYFWTDLAANFYAGSQSLCGPNSRTYDFLTHDYNLSQLYYLAGLPAKVSTEHVYLNDQVQIWASAFWNDYTPPAAALALASASPRLIRQRFGPEPGEDRTNYITLDFAIGSSSHSYGAQDRLVCATLASSKDLPFVSIVADDMDAPFGKISKVEKGGHRKIYHLEPTFSAVQDRGEVLALLDLGRCLGNEPQASIATNVLLPLQTDSLTIDGAPVVWNAAGTLPLTAESVVCVREGKAAIAVRLFLADTAPGSAPSFCLKNDGQQWGAARIVAYHYQGPAVPLALPSLRGGVLLLAATCATDGEFQNFVKRAQQWTLTPSSEGTLWRVTATGPGEDKGAPSTLEASIDPAARHTGPRRVNGEEIVSPILTINDIDWAAKIWSALPKN